VMVSGNTHWLRLVAYDASLVAIHDQSTSDMTIGAYLSGFPFGILFWVALRRSCLSQGRANETDGLVYLASLLSLLLLTTI